MALRRNDITALIGRAKADALRCRSVKHSMRFFDRALNDFTRVPYPLFWLVYTKHFRDQWRQRP